MVAQACPFLIERAPSMYLPKYRWQLNLHLETEIKHKLGLDPFQCYC